MAAEAARLVLKHSTHLPGLVGVLKRLSRHGGPGGIQTIVPGRLARTPGRREGFALRVTVPVVGGHKLVARRGQQCQEVFVVTPLARGALQALVDRAVGPAPRRAVSQPSAP